MLTTATTTSLTNTYDRSGRSNLWLRFEPARPIAFSGDQGSTTTAKYQDKVSLSPDGLKKSQTEETTGAGAMPMAATTILAEGGEHGAGRQRTALPLAPAETPSTDRGVFAAAAPQESHRLEVDSEQGTPVPSRRTAVHLFA